MAANEIRDDAGMDLTPDEQAIKDALDAYVASSGLVYYPDPETVERVVRGLAKRQAKTGHAYCPCRLVTGNAEADAKIVCPCAYHRKEIETQGYCHCRLFAREDFRP